MDELYGKEGDRTSAGFAGMLQEMRFLRYLREHRLAGGIAILAATQFLASLAGLLRENVLARVFADRLDVVDAFFAAFNPSDLIFQTCVVSALGTVLVPVLAQYRTQKNGDQVEKVLAGTIGMTSLLFGFAALLMAIFFPWLTPLFNIRFEGETLELYVQFGRLALLSNFLFVFGNAYGQYLVTVERYWIYGLTPVLYSLGTVFGAWFLTPYVGPFGPMYGTLLGALIYVLLRMAAVRAHGCRLRISLWHPDLPQMARLMLPRVLSLGALQLQILYLNGFASGLEKGAVTINTFARNFQSVLVGVVGISVAQALYSRLSHAMAERDQRKFDSYFRNGVKTTLILTILGAIALVLLTPLEARLVHMMPYLRTFAISLSIYAVSVPLESLTHIQYRALYAMKDTLYAAMVGVTGGIVAIAVGWFFLERFGLFALAMGYTAGEMAQVLGLSIIMPIRKRRFMKTKPTTADRASVVTDVE